VALVYIDGEYFPPEAAKISVFDHGFLYGDGIFEGIRAYNGRIFKLSEHVRRLYNGAKAIMLNIPMTEAEMAQKVCECVRRAELPDAYVRLVVSRGPGDLGLDPAKCKAGASVIIIADKISLYPDEFYKNGLRMVTVTTRRNITTALNPAIKSLNYLNNILARLEVSRAGCMEGLMLNQEGYVCECTGDNIFIHRNGKLITPPVSDGILEGITRATVMDLARKLRVEVSEERFTVFDVYTAQECLLTGTAAEVVPVVELDGRLIGDGKPGQLTKCLEDSYRELTRTEGIPV
jgi:branched-chain amino acid aminotransferase